MEYKLYKGDDELYHWGVLGMKWGVRRYQRKDGSLTPAGEKRLKKERAALKKEEQILKNRKATKAKLDRLAAKRKSLEEQKKELDGDDAKTKKGKSDEAKPTKKSVKDMTDDELVKAVNRGRLEEAYRQLYPEPPVKKSLLKKVVDDVVAPAATTAGKQFLQNALMKAGENVLKGKANIDPNSIEALTKIRDKLKLQNEIDRIKKGLSGKADDEINWMNMKKKREYDDETAEREAKANKAKADEAARKANEARSAEYYNSTYSRRPTNSDTYTSTNGKSTISGLLTSSGSSKVSNLPAVVQSRGKSTVSGLLNGSVGSRNPNEVGYMDKDGKLHVY